MRSRETRTENKSRMVRSSEKRRSDADNGPRLESHVSGFKEGGERGRGLDFQLL